MPELNPSRTQVFQRREPAPPGDDTASVEWNNCPACHEALANDSKFCPMCGARQPTDARPTAPNPAPAPSDEPETSWFNQFEVGAPKLPLCPRGEVEKPAPEPKTCACGGLLVDHAGFCPWCGLRAGEASPRFRLVGLTSEIKGKTFAVTKDELTIGKSEQCDVTIGADGYTSRRHARLSQSDGMVYLEDLGSSNGTFLRVRRAIALDAGDEIVVGQSVFRLEQCHEQRPSTEPAACQDPTN